MRRSWAVALLLVVMLTLAFAVPAYADQPVFSYGSEPTITLAGGWPCAATISFVGSGDYRQTDWLNDAGLTVRGFQAYSNVKAFFRNEDNGQTLKCNTAGSVHYSVVYNDDGSSDWTYVVTGTDAFVSIPGLGIVAGYTGQYTYVEHYDCWCNDASHWVASQDISLPNHWGWGDFGPSSLASFCAALGTTSGPQ